MTDDEPLGELVIAPELMRRRERPDCRERPQHEHRPRAGPLPEPLQHPDQDYEEWAFYAMQSAAEAFCRKAARGIICFRNYISLRAC